MKAHALRQHEARVPWSKRTRQRNGWRRPRSLLVLAGILGTASPVFAADEIHWTLTGQTSVTFDWRGPATEDLVYGPTSGSYPHTAIKVTPSPVPDSSAGPFWEARLTGLEADLIDRANLRVSSSLFFENLLRKEGKIIGRFDGRVVAEDGSNLGVLATIWTGGCHVTLPAFDPEQAVDILRRLKELGIRVAIDDFGTGYSSLAYLKRFPIDSVKVDRSFVEDIPEDVDSMAIAQAVIAMAHSLRLKVVAEGVESEAQLSFLRGEGCDEMQGHYFSEARAASEISGIMHRTLRRGTAVYLSERRRRALA